MELYIDGKMAETDSSTSLSISVSVADITAPEYARTGYSRTVSIPMTAINRAIMGDCEQVASRDRFNASLHTARIEQRGCMVMEGRVMLEACEKLASGGRYLLAITGTGRRWAEHAASHTISSLFPDYSATVSAEEIAASWSRACMVRWLPVYRPRQEWRYGSPGALVPERVLAAEDYHPFIHLRSLLLEIFRDAGYRLESSFLEGSLFDSLYMSGRYPVRDAALLRSRMDFLAGLSAEVSATADSGGMVKADPLSPYNSIGNIADTADPSRGQGLFSAGGCFALREGRACFVPPYAVTAGFEYRLRYSTGYRMLSASRLAGFDRIYLGNGCLHEFSIANRFADRRNEFRSGKEFRCVVFDHAEGHEYRLVADITSPSGTVLEGRTLARFYSRSLLFSTSAEGSFSALRMQSRSGEELFAEFAGSWALYDGSVEEEGQTEVEVVLRSAAETVTPGSPKYFDDIYFAGASAGTTLTLHQAMVRPLFMPHPTAGDTVSFGDVAAWSQSRMTVINAVRQMFGLCFYTDEAGGRVLAEPRNDFYRNDILTDWSDRLELSQPVRLSELASCLPAGTITWEYAGTDDGDNGFGRWQVQLTGTADDSLTRSHANPLFTATRNATGLLPSAPSASLPCITPEEGDEESLNFAPVVVRYMGMRPLPGGETWGWPSAGSSYPFLAFHSPDRAAGIVAADPPCRGAAVADEEPFTLCFEDRDGLQGLHKWWDGVAEAYSTGRKIEVRMRLGPEDVEALVRPNGLMHDFRSRFLLKLDGEPHLLRLEEVADYDPGAGTARCIFVKGF